MAIDVQTLKYIIEFDAKMEGNVKTALTSLGIQTQKYKDIADRTTVASKSLAESLARLAGRAALTIPIWQALRQVYVTSLQAFSDSVKSFVDLDTALKNVKNELQDTKDVAGVLKQLSEAAQGLSLETGLDPSKIVETFRQFKTAGIDAEASFAGMNTAVRGSVATMGDSVETARLLADVYNQMGDRITEVSGTQDKFNFIMSTIATLMPTNVFTFKEFGDALKNFVGTAKAANLTLDQTFTLVAASATAMQRGARGGTQIASAFSQLSRKSQEVSEFLGKDITGIDQFTVFTEVLKKASEQINKGGGANSSILQQIEEIFGARGGKDVKALASDLDHFTTELERLGNLSPDERMAQFMERFATASEKVALQSDRVKQTVLGLGRTFIDKTIDGEQLAKALSNIVIQLEKFKPTVEGASLSLSALLKSIAFIVEKGGVSGLIGGVGSEFTGKDESKRVKEKGLSAGTSLLSPTNFFTALGLLDELADSKESLFIINKQNDALDKRLILAKKLKDLGKAPLQGFTDLPPDLQFKDRELERKNRGSTGPVITPLKAAGFSSEADTIADEVLKVRQDLFKNEGALTSQLLQQEELLKKQLGIQDNQIDKVKRHLELERALSEEKRLQGRIGNDSLKLFEIAQKFGVEQARKIGDVLAGNKDFTTFARQGGKDFNVFEQFFPELKLQKQAEEFFKGNVIKGFQPLQGGTRIPIQEEAIRKQTLPVFDIEANLMQRKAEVETGLIKKGIDANIVNLRAGTVKLNLSPKENDDISQNNLLTNSSKMAQDLSFDVKELSNVFRNFPNRLPEVGDLPQTEQSLKSKTPTTSKFEDRKLHLVIDNESPINGLIFQTKVIEKAFKEFPNRLDSIVGDTKSTTPAPAKPAIKDKAQLVNFVLQDEQKTDSNLVTNDTLKIINQNTRALNILSEKLDILNQSKGGVKSPTNDVERARDNIFTQDVLKKVIDSTNAVFKAKKPEDISKLTNAHLPVTEQQKFIDARARLSSVQGKEVFGGDITKSTVPVLDNTAIETLGLNTKALNFLGQRLGSDKFVQDTIDNSRTKQDSLFSPVTQVNQGIDVDLIDKNLRDSLFKFVSVIKEQPNFTNQDFTAQKTNQEQLKQDFTQTVQVTFNITSNNPDEVVDKIATDIQKKGSKTQKALSTTIFGVNGGGFV